MKIFLIVLLIILILFLTIFCIVFLIHHKIFGSRFTKDPLITYYSPDEFNIKRKVLEVPFKKMKLRGYIYNYDKKTKDELIIFAHGMGSNIDAYNQDICYLAGKGYEVIGINYQGVSTSDGKNIKGLASNIESISCLLDYLKTKDEYKNKDIYLIGHSWGANAVLNIVKYHKDIKKVVAISPFISNNSLLSTIVPKIFRFVIPFFNIIEYFKFKKFANQNVIKNITSFKGETLILHSKDDPILSYKNNTYKLIENLPKLNYLIVNEKGHNPEYTKDAVKYLNEFYTKLEKIKPDLVGEYKKSADYKKMGELDNTVMDEIVKFFEK